jgi:hypothetical protein
VAHLAEVIEQPEDVLEGIRGGLGNRQQDCWGSWSIQICASRGNSGRVRVASQRTHNQARASATAQGGEAGPGPPSPERLHRCKQSRGACAAESASRRYTSQTRDRHFARITVALVRAQEGYSRAVHTPNSGRAAKTDRKIQAICRLRGPAHAVKRRIAPIRSPPGVIRAPPRVGLQVPHRAP